MHFFVRIDYLCLLCPLCDLVCTGCVSLWFWFPVCAEDQGAVRDSSEALKSVCRVTFNEGLVEPKSMERRVQFYLL